MRDEVTLQTDEEGISATMRGRTGRSLRPVADDPGLLQEVKLQQIFAALPGSAKICLRF